MRAAALSVGLHAELGLPRVFLEKWPQGAEAAGIRTE